MAEKNPCLLQLQSFLRWINVIFMQLYLSLYLPSQCTFEKFERRDWFLHPLLLILLPHLRRSLTAIPHSWKSSLLEAQIQGEGEGARPLKSKNLQVVMCKLYVITMEIKVSFLEVNLQIFHLILRFSPQILTAIALLSGIPFSPWRSAPPSWIGFWIRAYTLFPKSGRRKMLCCVVLPPAQKKIVGQMCTIRIYRIYHCDVLRRPVKLLNLGIRSDGQVGFTNTFS